MLSDKQLARVAGFCYLLVIAAGLFSEVFVRQALRVPDDALATAHNIRLHEMLYRWGLVADLFNFIVGLPSVLILYSLFKRLHPLLLRLALGFVVVQTAVIALNLVFQVLPLLLLGDDQYVHAFPPPQLAALALLALNVQAQGYGIGLVFFGCYCLIIGYVIYRYRPMPRGLGILYAAAGAGYLINSFTMLLSRNFANPLFAYLAVPIFIGELSVCLWLLIKGVQLPEQAAGAA